MDCIFCKIANKEIPKDFVYEDEKIMVFEDINPKAPVHLLIIPKKHIASLDEVGEEDKELIGEIILTAQKVAKDYNPPTASSRRRGRRAPKKLKGYKLVINVGRGAGQLIDHLHLHLLAGRPMRMP